MLYFLNKSINKKKYFKMCSRLKLFVSIQRVNYIPTAFFFFFLSAVNLYHSLGEFNSRQIGDTFLIFPRKTGFDILCKLSPVETICMKCQILFSGKNRKSILKCHLLKILSSMPSVKNDTHIYIPPGKKPFSTEKY